MSFDLYFVTRDGKITPTLDALTDWWETKPIGVETDGENGMLTYDNRDTGVYFALSRSSESLHLNINYCRPTFFVLETAALIQELVARFSLLVQNPDENGIVEYDSDKLIESWRSGNRFACSAIRSMGENLLEMEEAKANALSHYLRDRSQIATEYDEYFVPHLKVVQLDSQLLRGAHLTRPTFYVMPPVDIFFLENDRIVWADRVLSVLKSYLTQLEGFDRFNAISDDTCFDTYVMDVWETMYDELTPDFQMSQVTGKAVKMDGFVDVKLER